MKKYFTIIKTEWERQITYITNTIGFRTGNLLEVLVQLIIWSAIFRSTNIIKGYTYEMMMTYIIIGWLILFLTSTYDLNVGVSRDIHMGNLSKYIVRPLSYIRYITVYSIGRSSFSMLSGLAIQVLILVSYIDKIVWTGHIPSILLIVIMVILGYFIELFLSIIIGLLAFWFTEVNGLYFALGVVRKLLSGAYFPISLLPASYLTLSKMFPFVYTFFVPTQLFIGKISFSEGLLGLAIEIVWVLILYGLIKLIWNRGLHKYEGYGI